jgi:sulfite reductase alpha subunit-like flavoprotein
LRLQKGDRTENQADDYLKALEAKRRLQKDVWS